MGDVREDIAAIDGDVVETRESLEAELDDLRAEVSALSAELDRIGSIEREIEELQRFRDRVNSAFGPGE
jgi:prefoldin subunit 5